MATIYGNTINGYWRVYLTYTLNNNYSATHASIAWSYGINWVKDVKGNDSANNYSSSNDRPTYVACTGQTTQYRYPTATFTKDNSWAGRSIAYGSGTYYIPKKTTAQSITLKALITHTPKSSSTLYKGTSQKSVALSISALAKYTIDFAPNPKIEGASVENMPASITKFHNVNVALPSTIPTEEGYAFVAWNTLEDGSGTDYSSGASYGGNTNTTLYVKWGAADPPTFDENTISFSTSGGDVVRGFTTVSCDYNVDYVHDGRTLDTVTLNIAGHTATSTAGSDTLTVGVFDETDEGTQTILLIVEDSEGAIGRYEIGTVEIVSPTWEKTLIIDEPFPSIDGSGNAILDSVEVKNYTTSTYDTVPKSGYAFIDNGDDTWSFKYAFDEDHVDDATSETPNVDVVLSYKHYDGDVSIGNKAFYSTSRNQNYSNGIYNVMFVGGVDNSQFPDFTSRVWWCKINDPLYFPDTNYIEVGSNDTAVQGLTKVGDYLAVIKQSKTTDTAIFLLYPTSFEEETTYAVKQGVQGVGALSKYSFNILGDETLFLSPKGVMAIVPTQDEEHKVQNRSYFIDKKLLAEDGIESSYSFVYDGKYFLSIGNGHCYVLDGNQRNSWGNDRTVLVYECYFLDNVPANCFVKYQDRLVFSTIDDVCMFGDNYTDSYDATSDDREPVAVKAEWSTIFDDDGSLHYYKTMQKKGNLVSILPVENAETSSTQVLVKKDDKDPVEIERKFNESSEIPSEMFLNKKFKKYKRLQFILRNESDENFGVDSIVKNYTVGNYAKK